MPSTLERLLDPQRPAVEYGELHTIDAEVLRAVVRILRGSRARTEVEFFNELSAAMQLSLDFGGNWAALADSLRDVVVYGEGRVVLIVTEAEELLATAYELSFLSFLDVATVIDREAQEQGTGRVRVLLTQVPGGLSRIQPRVEDIGLPVTHAAFEL
jgi:hypothetical protein